ncbi:MAG TPA: hypothetical protein VFA19_16265 [Gaiellaceae bacterium]|nr:hypothetical protein [Gaiellaceae bacterium]
MLIALTAHQGTRLGEIGFLLDAIAGGLLFVGSAPGFRRLGTLLGGLALAAGSVLLIVAVHWGRFGIP